MSALHPVGLLAGAHAPQTPALYAFSSRVPAPRLQPGSGSRFGPHPVHVPICAIKGKRSPYLPHDRRSAIFMVQLAPMLTRSVENDVGLSAMQAA